MQELNVEVESSHYMGSDCEVLSEITGNMTQRMYEDEFDEENEIANKPDENPMTLPTIKKRRQADRSYFGVYNNMD